MTDPKNQTNQTNTTDAALPPVDDYATATEALREKLADAQTPGYQAEFDPEEAERAGARIRAIGDERVFYPMSDAVIRALSVWKGRAECGGAGQAVGAHGMRVELGSRDQILREQFAQKRGVGVGRCAHATCELRLRVTEI